MPILQGKEDASAKHRSVHFHQHATLFLVIDGRVPIDRDAQDTGYNVGEIWGHKYTQARRVLQIGGKLQHLLLATSQIQRNICWFLDMTPHIWQ